MAFLPGSTEETKYWTRSIYDVGSVMTSKLGMATYRPRMALQTIHLNLIWRLGLPLKILGHIQRNNSLTFCKYSMNQVDSKSVCTVQTYSGHV